MNTSDIEHLLWILTYAAAVSTKCQLGTEAIRADQAVIYYRNSSLYNEDPNPPEEWVDEDVPKQ